MCCTNWASRYTLSISRNSVDSESLCDGPPQVRSSKRWTVSSETLTSDMLVIADAEKPLRWPASWVVKIGNLRTQTTDVLIESAYFDPDSVRQTARNFGMDTEASRRFERGADCEGVLRAQQRCVELICELQEALQLKMQSTSIRIRAAERVVEFRPDAR